MPKKEGIAENKIEAIERMSQSANITKAAAKKALEALFAGITESLVKGQRTTFVGFGTFSVSARKAKKGRNPQTGENITIPARVVPKFTPGAELKSAVGGTTKK